MSQIRNYSLKIYNIKFKILFKIRIKPLIDIISKDKDKA